MKAVSGKKFCKLVEAKGWELKKAIYKSAHIKALHLTGSSLRSSPAGELGR